MIRSVMLALSGSPYTPTAARYALEVAKRHGSVIAGVSFADIHHLQHEAVPVGAIAPKHRLTEESVTRARRRVTYARDAFVDAARAAGVEHSVLEQEGDPIDHLISEWRYHDLTVFGLRGLFDCNLFSEPEHILHRLITAGVRPVLAVSKSWRPIERVLVATSGSLTSSKVLKRWLQLRLWPDAEIHLVHIGRKEAHIDEHMRRTAGYCALHGARVATRRVVDGHARVDLLPYAQRVNADLIVMGDSARSLLSRALFGDTALHLVKNADRPLFISH